MINFIEAYTYEKYLSNQINFDMTLPEERKVQTKLAIKDEYAFDFAELSPEYPEHKLEMRIVNNIRAFLIEMGGVCSQNPTVFDRIGRAGKIARRKSFDWYYYL